MLSDALAQQENVYIMPLELSKEILVEIVSVLRGELIDGIRNRLEEIPIMENEKKERFWALSDVYQILEDTLEGEIHATVNSGH